MQNFINEIFSNIFLLSNAVMPRRLHYFLNFMTLSCHKILVRATNISCNQQLCLMMFLRIHFPTHARIYVYKINRNVSKKSYLCFENCDMMKLRLLGLWCLAATIVSVLSVRINLKYHN